MDEEEQTFSVFSDPALTKPTAGARPFESGTLPAPASERVFSAPEQPAKLQDAAKRAAAMPPEKAARILTQSRRTGFPTDLVERNLDAIEQQTKAVDFDVEKYRAESPLLADWLTAHPINLAVAQDDLRPLSAIETAMRFASNATGITAGGLYKGLDLGAWSALEAVGAGLKLPWLEDFGKRQNEVAEATKRGLTGEQRGVGEIEKMVYEGFGSMGSSAPILLSAVLTGGATLTPAAELMVSRFGLGLMATQTGGAGYSTMRAQGGGFASSLLYGTSQGIIEAGTEAAPFHKLVGDLAKRSGFFKTLLHQVVPELVGENVATLGQDLNDWAALPESRDKTFGDYIRERPSAFLATTIATLVQTGAQTGSIHAVNRMVQAAVGQQTLEDLGKAARESKTLERDPAAVAEFIAHVSKDGVEKLYAPIDSFTTWFQSQGIDPAEMAHRLTGSDTAYDDAVKAQTDLAIPTAAYVTQLAATDHHAFFEKELRVGDPKAANVREEEMARPAAERTSAEDSAAKVREHVTAQLRAAGFPEQMAVRQGQVFEAVFGTLAAKAKLDPLTLYQRYGLTVERPSLQPDAPAAAATTTTEVTAEAAPAAAPVATVTGFSQNVEGIIAPRYAVPGHVGPVTHETLAAEGIPLPALPPTLATWTATTEGTARQDAMIALAEAELATPAPPVVERRSARGVGPDGVERRNAPITGTLAERMAQMRAENPNIDKEGKALGERARAAKPEAPPRSKALDAVPLATVLFQTVEDAEPETLDPVLDGPRGFDVIAPHLTPEERANARTKAIASIADTFESLPEDLDFVDVALAGSVVRGWYQRAVDSIREVFGEQDTPRFVALLASMSPRVGVRDNLLNAAAMWRIWIQTGRSQDRDVILELAALAVRGSGAPESVLDSWRNNMVEALTSPTPENITLSGPKVQSFNRNLLGYMQEVTNDAWMATFSAVEQTLFAGTDQFLPATETRAKRKYGGKSPGYLAMSAKVRRVAAILTERTGEEWTPANVQETVWSWAKTLYELAEDEKLTAVQVLQQGKLTDAVIATAPEFAAMLTEDVTIRGILERAGYGEQVHALEQVFLSDPARRGAARRDRSAGTGREGASGEDRSPTLGEFRSAQRLDAVRAQRLAAKATLAADKASAAAAKEAKRAARAAKKAGPDTTLYQTVEAQTESPEFRAWFGASQVVSSADLEPLVVYHNTSAEFDAFDPAHGELGFHFGTAAQASKRGGTKTLGVFLRMEHPIHLSEDPGYFGRLGFLDQLVKDNVLTPDESKDLLARMDASDKVNAVHGATRERAARFVVMRDYLKAKGYDGVQYPNGYEGDGDSYMVFDPDQVKSATGNRGTFDGTSGNIYYQGVDEPAGTFYSRLTRAVEDSKQAKANGAQWKASIRNAKSGINKDEFALAHVSDLEDGVSYTRQEVLDYLKANAVHVEVFTLSEAGGIDAELVEDRARQLFDAAVDAEVEGSMYRSEGYGQIRVKETEDDEGTYWQFRIDGRWHDDPYGSEEEAQQAAESYVEEHQSDYDEARYEAARENVSWDDALKEAQGQLEDEGAEGDGIKFGDYVEPGADEGSNREVFLQMPNAPRDRFAEITARPVVGDVEGHPPGTTRFAFDVNGKPWLDAEGRAMTAAVAFREGFTPDQVAQVAVVHGEALWRRGADRADWRDGHDAYQNIENPWVRIRLNDRTAPDGTLVSWIEEAQPPNPENQKLMPPLLVKNWREGAFKWALRDAVNRGRSAVVWTRGETQARRYGLEHAVRDIMWSPAPPAHLAGGAVTKVNIEAIDGGKIALAIDAAGRVTARIEGGAHDWVGKPLSDVIGKEVAARILDTPDGTLEGEGLKIGGAGLTRLYDVDFVNVVNGLPAVKRNGGRVEMIEMSASGRTHADIDAEIAALTLAHETERTATAGYNTRLARLQMERDETLGAVPGIRITPQMRDYVLGGQALFQEPQPGEPTPERRGSIRFGADRQFTISLFEKANLSTFLHESAHFFLEVMTDLAPESPEIARDLATARAWLFPEGDTGQPITTAQHEQWARGFERYLMEGVAPTTALREAFSSFRAWMLDVYKTLTGLRVTLNPDVRQVFDRMLASDQAIAEEEGRRVAPMFTTAEAAGMTPEAFARYGKTIEMASRTAREQLEQTLLKEMQRTRTAAWKAERAGVEADVRHELSNTPVYQALAEVKRGTPADMVADVYGFSSGDELRALRQTTPPLATAITAETEKRMQAAHPSALLDGTLAEEAAAAVSNEGRAEVVRQEMAALRKLQRTVKPFVRDAVAAVSAEKQTEIDALQTDLSAKNATTRGAAAAIHRATPSRADVEAHARARIARTLVKELKPAVFWAAARRAAQHAIDRAARQDIPGAIAAKTQETVALALHREAVRVVADLAVRVGRAQALGTGAARARLGLAGSGYLDQVDGILDRYQFAPVTQKALKRRVLVRNWVAELERQGMPAEGLPDEVLNDSRRIHYTEATVEEIVGITDGLQMIAHLARLKNRLLTAQDRRTFEQRRDALAASIREHTTARKFQYEKTSADKVGDWIDNAYASNAKLSLLVFEMDGHVDAGPMWQAFQRTANAAADAEESRNVKEGLRYNAILEQFYPGRERLAIQEQKFIPALNASLSLEARLAIGAYWGSEDGRERLRNDPTRPFTEAQLLAIIDSLDERDWKYLAAHHAFLDSFWPEIEAKEQRLTGLKPEKVEALTIQTRFGEQPGGYHPIAYDGTRMARAGQLAKITEAKLTTAAAYTRTVTKKGYTETRVAHTGLPLRLDMTATFNHVRDVVHDLTHHEMLIDVNRLLRDSAVSQAIIDTRGDIVYGKITKLFEDIAAGAAGGGGKNNFADWAARFLKSRSQVAGMAWNTWTALQQPIGLFNGMERVGVKWVAKGVKRWLRDAAHFESTTTWIANKSAMMANRMTTANPDMRDVQKTLREPGGWFDKLVRTVSADHVTQQAILDSYLWHIGMAQRIADVPTWLGEYEKQMHQNPGDEAQAIALADQAVLDSQGGGQLKDLTDVQRGGDVAKLFMTFASYGVTVLNSAARRTGQTNFKSPASALAFLGGLSLLYVVPAILTEAMRCATGRAACDEVPAFIAKVGGQILGDSLNGIIFAREGSSALKIVAGMDPGSRGYEGPAGTRLVQMSFQAATDVGHAIKQGEVTGRAVKSTTALAGAALQLPTAQMIRSIEGWIALQEGRTSNPGALVFGPPPKGN